MKNYYTQLSELAIAETRLETLKEKKELLLTNATKTTGSLREIVAFGGGISNKPLNYVVLCEEVDKQIEAVEKEIRILKKGLSQMENILKSISGIEEKIFRLYYMENKNPTQISFIIPCDRRTVYRYLKKIKEKCKLSQNATNKGVLL